MLHQIKKIFSSNDLSEQVSQVYIALVEQARKPFFYKELKVPDTLDGRFELILLHMFLMLYRFKQEEERGQFEEFNRQLVEYLFSDMDRSLREMGVGDAGVSRRVKQMANALYGRLSHYEKGAKAEESLRDALLRNVYGTTSVNHERVTQLEIYVQTNLVLLKQQNVFQIWQGDITFFNPIFDDALLVD